MPSSISASSKRTSTGTRRRTPPRRSSSGRTTEATARTCAGSRRAGSVARSSRTGPSRTRPCTNTAVIRQAPGRRPLEAVASASVRVHLVVPRSFNDAQSIADKFKESVPVIVNLQGTDCGALEAADRLLERADVRAQRLDAARRGQGLPAHAAERRGLRGRACAPHRPRLLQPVLDRPKSSPPPRFRPAVALGFRPCCWRT